MLMADPDSPTMRRVAQVLGASRFTGTIVDVSIEETSTRGLITLETQPSTDHPGGREAIRTERTDHPDGQAMTARARRLVGHRVLVFKDMQDVKGSATARKVRICVHLLDLGLRDATTGTIPAAVVPQSPPRPPDQPAPAEPAGPPTPATLAALRAGIGELGGGRQRLLREWCRERTMKLGSPATEAEARTQLDADGLCAFGSGGAS